MLIGELAERAGTSTRALRYYEEQGLLAPDRSPSGYRIYAPEAVLQVRRIRALLAAGFSSTSVATILPCVTGESPQIQMCPVVRAEVDSLLRGIEADAERLERQRAAVSEMAQG